MEITGIGGPGVKPNCTVEKWASCAESAMVDWNEVMNCIWHSLVSPTHPYLSVRSCNVLWSNVQMKVVSNSQATLDQPIQEFHTAHSNTRDNPLILQPPSNHRKNQRGWHSLFCKALRCFLSQWRVNFTTYSTLFYYPFADQNPVLCDTLRVIVESSFIVDIN